MKFLSITLLLLFNVFEANSANSHEIEVSTFADGLDRPWGMSFLPDGRLLVTEKIGHLRLIDTNGKASEPLANMIPVKFTGQGGLLDVTIDPDFDNHPWIYFSYTKAADNGHSRTAVGKAKLIDNQLQDVQQIWQQKQSEKGGYHYGSRLVFDRKGYLFVTLGDRNYRKDEAQDLKTHFGKIVRIDTHGQPAKDNPFIDNKDALPDIYSYGHRNVQGAYLHPETGELWANEHGPRGGDEINLIKAGKNYGWPKITYGINYNFTKITDHTELPGMEQPIHYWDPSIATSGMLIYTGGAFPNWQGDIFTGALKMKHLNRIKLNENNKVIYEERLLTDQNERIRAIAQGPDGLIYVATDSSEGRILKLSPK
ncbi:MAG: PQQ-dependent sugar dehydrogenase [Marinicella sp.]